MKRWTLILSMIACALLTSCSLLPEEETFSTAPLLQEYRREEFKQTFAERGEMVLTQKISCTYVPVQTEALRYTVGGVYYDETFVEVGDSVVVGQLLAQLDLGSIEDSLTSCNMQIEKLGIRMAALEENRALALERQRLSMTKSTENEIQEALKKVNEQYDRQRQSIEDELKIAELQKKEYEQELADRQLRAGINGTVTYVRKTSSGERSTAGDRFISIADSTMSLFRADTEHWNLFEPGQEVVITASKVEYEAVVASEAELGLPETEKAEGQKAYVYLKLKHPTFDLEDGDRGTMTIVLDSRENALMVPESAVTTADGQHIVYYQDEEGMKAYKPVEVGLYANGMVEIISGLTEGESVIVE